MKKDDFEQSMEAMFKDFNMAMQSKDNFIAQNMDVLERLVDKTSIVQSDSLRNLLFGHLDEEVEREMKEQKREERAAKAAAKEKEKNMKKDPLGR